MRKETARFVLAFCFVAPLAAQAPPETAHQRWLDDDAKYLIDDDERAAFLALSTDEEREKFIEQFWLRRDPTPGTPENERKEEHYRRIAYSNSRFAFAPEPGWRSDRGRVYVVYGPPEEVEAHPSGGRSRDGSFDSADGYEIWGYRPTAARGALTFTFVDEGSAGRYVLHGQAP